MINDYLLDFIGKTGTEKNILEAKSYLIENRIKELNFKPRPNCFSLVRVEVDGEIKSIGGSEPLDLLNDNFGKILAQMFRNVSTTGQELISLKSIGGVNSNFSPYWFADVGFGKDDWRGMLVQAHGSISPAIQIGKGSSPATRQDVDIENPFTNGGAEDSQFGIQVPIYDVINFRCNFANSIISGGSGSITESVYKNSYTDRNKARPRVLIARDNISPAVGFLASQSIFVDYTLQF